MASNIQDELYRKFLEVAGRQSSHNADTRAMLTDVVAEFRASQNGLPQATTTAATTSTSAAKDSGGISVGSVASTILKSGFGLPALIGGVFGLFRGGDQEAPAPLVKYAMPDSVQFQAAESNSRFTALDYDQMGLARSYSE